MAYQIYISVWNGIYYNTTILHIFIVLYCVCLYACLSDLEKSQPLGDSNFLLLALPG